MTYHIEQEGDLHLIIHSKTGVVAACPTAADAERLIFPHLPATLSIGVNTVVAGGAAISILYKLKGSAAFMVLDTRLLPAGDTLCNIEFPLTLEPA